MKSVCLFITALLFLGFKNNLDSQKHELKTLYITALNQRNDLLSSSNENYFEINEITSELLSDSSIDTRFKFLSFTDLYKTARKEKQGSLKYHRINHSSISIDTIDINFTEVSLRIKKGIFLKKKLSFHRAEATYSKMLPYKPDLRFVKGKESDDWKLIINKFSNNSE